MLVQIITENGQKKIIPLTADAGAGNPVGTIIVVCSNRVPSNYLPLGTQYDTTQYPLLYAELGTDTTPTASALGLPTLSSGQYAIKATSGLSENAQDNVVAQLNEERSYSTEEVNTGKKWIDGKPIYRIVFHSATNWADGTKIGTISNLDYVISIKNLSISDTNFSYENYGTNGNYISLATVKTNGEVYINRGSSFNNSKPSSVIVEYTKTT